MREQLGIVISVISKSISDDIPPQMKMLNMLIPILMHFCSFILNLTIRNSWMKGDVVNDVKLFSTVYRISQDILLQIFDVIQSKVALQ